MARRTLQLIDILVFYDIPQLFIAKFEDSDINLICMLEDVGRETGECQYLGVCVSPSRLENFLLGKIDLRDAFTDTEFDMPFYDVAERGGRLEAEQLTLNNISEDKLPEAGFYCDNA